MTPTTFSQTLLVAGLLVVVWGVALVWAPGLILVGIMVIVFGLFGVDVGGDK